jgi:hypothetical protein
LEILELITFLLSPNQLNLGYALFALLCPVFSPMISGTHDLSRRSFAVPQFVTYVLTGMEVFLNF